jgi:hypothetical protein
MNPTDILLGLEKIIDAIKSTSAAQFFNGSRVPFSYYYFGIAYRRF